MATVHRATPTLTALDPRGLVVRSVAYCRSAADGPADVRIHRTEHDRAGWAVALWDPRLLADPSAPANLATLYSLRGHVLGTESVDAGWRRNLWGAAQQWMNAWDGRGTLRRNAFDLRLRPLAVFEQGGCTERYRYGDGTFPRNQRGLLIRHDDPAGTVLFTEYGVAGQALQHTRRFLQALDAPDWPEALAQRDALLEPAPGATSHTRFNAVAEVVEQTDAKGHRQLFSHTPSGQLRQVQLQLAGQGNRQTLVSAIRYDAQGRTEQETAGNGVVTTLTYRAEDGRLIRLHAAGPQVLQNLHYAYDPVGNVLELHPGQTLAWDRRNQLHEVQPVQRDSAPDDSERYLYGGDGLRVRKVQSSQTHTRTVTRAVRYLPGLEIRTRPSETLHVIVVQAGRNSVRVLHWETPPPVANDQIRYSASDHLGSCTLELDSAGAVISHETYHPFGTTAWFAGRSEVEARYKTVGYSNKERDATGLYYYGFRYYIPWLQRWVNPDPAGEVDGHNFYGFVSNHPIGFVDWSGLIKWPWEKSRSVSSGVNELAEIFNRPNEDQRRLMSKEERERMGVKLNYLASNSQDGPTLREYAEGDTGLSDQINNHLRGLPTTTRNIEEVVKTFKAEVAALPEYKGEAYRAFRAGKDVFNGVIREGHTVADQGFMSASVVPHNVVHWLESWADNKTDVVEDQQRVLICFDECVPKKIAATGFLFDHLLVVPMTQLKVKEIRTVVSEGRQSVTIVGLKYAGENNMKEVRNIRTGTVLLTAADQRMMRKN